jgi:hypothetical protein
MQTPAHSARTSTLLGVGRILYLVAAGCFLLLAGYRAGRGDYINGALTLGPAFCLIAAAVIGRSRPVDTHAGEGDPPLSPPAPDVPST